MGRELTHLDEVEDKPAEALLQLAHNQPAELEQFMMELLRTARSDGERYFPCLFYGEILMEVGRWDESGDFLIRSAQIALSRRDGFWLALSHEKLGDLSAAEENWLGALHHYRYSPRKGGSLLDQSVTNRLEAKANGARTTLLSTVLSRDPDIIPLTRNMYPGAWRFLLCIVMFF